MVSILLVDTFYLLLFITTQDGLNTCGWCSNAPTLNAFYKILLINGRSCSKFPYLPDGVFFIIVSGFWSDLWPRCRVGYKISEMTYCCRCRDIGEYLKHLRAQAIREQKPQADWLPKGRRASFEMIFVFVLPQSDTLFNRSYAQFQ